MCIAVAAVDSSGPKNIPNLCISEIYRWAESVSDSSKFRCPLAGSFEALDYIGRL